MDPVGEDPETTTDDAQAALAGMNPEAIVKILSKTSAKNTRIIAQYITRQRYLKLFGDTAEKEAHWRDAVAVQVLFQFRDLYNRVLAAPLGDEETVLDREKRALEALTALDKAQHNMMQQANRLLESTGKLMVEARKLEVAQRQHEERIEVEKLRIPPTPKIDDTVEDAELQALMDRADEEDRHERAKP